MLVYKRPLPGELSDEEIIKILQSCEGDCYPKQRNHLVLGIDEHIL